MRRGKLISCLTAMVGIMMISMGLVLQDGKSLGEKTNIRDFNLNSMAASTSLIQREKEEVKVEKENLLLADIVMDTAPAGVSRIEVYEGMTLEEIANQLEKTLRNDLSGHGYFIAQKSIEYGVDPFIATAIMMHETGCGQNQFSSLARNCYNFGGQKGPGCGAYRRYYSIDEGLEGMIANLYRNYYAYGLTTVEQIGPKYAESDTWVSKINWYVNKIKTA
jgi:hypothetical protein